jgi:hypothetical protein
LVSARRVHPDQPVRQRARLGGGGQALELFAWAQVREAVAIASSVIDWSQSRRIGFCVLEVLTISEDQSPSRPASVHHPVDVLASSTGSSARAPSDWPSAWS